MSLPLKTKNVLEVFQLDTTNKDVSLDHSLLTTFWVCFKFQIRFREEDKKVFRLPDYGIR